MFFLYNCDKIIHMLNIDLKLRNYAHLGDSVWEVFVRNYTITKTSNTKILHKLTTDRVNAKFQRQMLEYIESELTEEELEIVRRARNLSIPIARRSIQKDYRCATAFEVLVGIWYLEDNERLNIIFEKIKKIDFFR